MQLLNRSGLAAIAAATALISTPTLAQEAAPATAEPAPIVADEPVTIEPLPVPETTTDTLAPAEAATVAPVTSRVTRTVRPTTAPATRVPAPVARSVTPVATAPVATATPAAETTISPDPAMVAPVPEAPVAAPVAPISESVMDSDLMPIAGAAGLGILALAGAGFAMRRRRRADDELVVQDEWHEPVMARPAPVETDPIAAADPLAAAPVTASAFNWGSTPERASTEDTSINRIEAAKRGPTPENPSLSLKKRLKRAAFFDQRDRAIAAGKAAPVSAMAGLPESMAKPTIQPTPKPVAATKPTPRFPDSGMRISFGKTLQPA